MTGIDYAMPAGRRPNGMRKVLRQHRGPLLSVAFFLAMLASISMVTGRLPSSFGISTLLASAATLALASIGQTITVVGGGLDLSAGAVVGFTQAVLVAYLAPTGLPAPVLIVLTILVGSGIGAVNGIFVAGLGLQPIIVTLSTMFAVNGLTLLVLPKPGGAVPDDLVSLMLDDRLWGIVPGPFLVLVVALLVWAAIKSTPLGTAIFASGSDSQAAKLAGLPVRRAVWSTYSIAGGFYGAAGAFVAAQSGGGDPLIGNPLLVSTLTAVMLGGTILGGGRGSAIGSVFGSLTLILMVNLLLAAGAPDYFSSGIQAVVLLLAVIVNRPAALGGSEVQRLMLALRRPRVGQHRADRLGRFRVPSARSVLPRDMVKFIIPAWIGLVALTLVSMAYYSQTFTPGHYLDRLLVLGAFTAILALGQGVVIIGGGIDLSLGWCVTTCGVVATMLMQGSDVALIWAVPLVLLLGLLIGVANGMLVAVLGLSPIVATLAVAGLLQSAVMFVSGGTPSGDAAPALRWLLMGDAFGITPLDVALLLFALFGTVLLACTPLSRRLVAVGSNAAAARLSGVSVPRTVIASYALCGCCGAVTSLLLDGFLGRSSLTMGDSYLLPTVAAVAVGGTLITGGRGHYAGMFGGALSLTALQIFLSGTSLPAAVRDITLGVAVMLAVVSLREK